MIMKSLSSKDVVLIKRAIKKLLKEDELLQQHTQRGEILLKELDNDETDTIWEFIYRSIQKTFEEDLKKEMDK